jgi:hypothetical protein
MQSPLPAARQLTAAATVRLGPVSPELVRSAHRVVFPKPRPELGVQVCPRERARSASQMARVQLRSPVMGPAPQSVQLQARSPDVPQLRPRIPVHARLREL